ncbi:MAG: putative membrane spanning protein [uncultured bacterium]|nr:MAG: putative membrane spanning protein [uncultured bacterium]
MSNVWLAIANPVGLLGVLLVLIAYFFLSTGRWNSDSLSFQVSNFLSAILILYSLYFHWNLSSVIIEIAWIAISVLGIFRILTVKSKLNQ